MYILRPSNLFRRKLKRLIKRNSEVEAHVAKTLALLREDPFSPSLRSHKITDSSGSPAFSSRVTGDLRIIWDYDREAGEARVLDLLDVGGHSGSKKVYRT